MYSADGRSLYYVSPNVLELPEAAQFGAGARVNHDLQFGSKLMRIEVPAGK